MAGSWRSILEGVPLNPPDDQHPAHPGKAQQRPAGPGPQRRPPAQYHAATRARGELERELAAFSGRIAENGPPPAPAPGQPAGYRQAPPGPAYPAENRPPAPVGMQPAGPEWGRRTEEGVPYNSLMAALSRATPELLPEPEKHLPAVYRQPAKSRKRRSKLPWRTFVSVSVAVAAVSLSGYVYLQRGGQGGAEVQASAPRASAPNASITQASASLASEGQDGSKSDLVGLGGNMMYIPLPERRPPALGAQEPLQPAVSGSAVVVERHPFLPSGDN
jgi:hypothetical protein